MRVGQSLNISIWQSLNISIYCAFGVFAPNSPGISGQPAFGLADRANAIAARRLRGMIISWCFMPLPPFTGPRYSNQIKGAVAHAG